MLTIVQAHSQSYRALVTQLFREYERSIPVDLCFQNFDREVTELPGRYAPPDGRLLVTLVVACAWLCHFVPLAADYL